MDELVTTEFNTEFNTDFSFALYLNKETDIGTTGNNMEIVGWNLNVEVWSIFRFGRT